MMSGRFSAIARFHQPCQPFAHDRSHAAHNKSGIGDAKSHSPRPDHAATGDHRVGQARAFLLGDQPIAIRFLIFELERVGGAKVGVPLFKGAFVQNLADTFLRGHVEVVVALRADAEQRLSLFDVDGRPAARAFLPKPFRHATFGPFSSDRRFRFSLSHSLFRHRVPSDTMSNIAKQRHPVNANPERGVLGKPRLPEALDEALREALPEPLAAR